MTRISQRLLALYLASLLALAALGAHNQLRHGQHEALVGQKSLLEVQLSALRQEAAGVTGVLAIRGRAVGRGMVAAPEALNVTQVDAVPALLAPLPQGEFEMHTLWR